jgi:hypothetical protein
MKQTNLGFPSVYQISLLNGSHRAHIGSAQNISGHRSSNNLGSQNSLGPRANHYKMASRFY